MAMPAESVAVTKPSTFGPAQSGSSKTHLSMGERHVIDVPTRCTARSEPGGLVPSRLVNARVQCQLLGVHWGKKGPRTPEFIKMKCVKLRRVLGRMASMPSLRSSAPWPP